MYRFFPLLALFSAAATLTHAQTPLAAPTPPDPKTQLKEAKENFNPWYAGPSLLGSANMAEPGDLVFSPYLFFYEQYALLNQHHDSVNIPNTYILGPVLSLQAGITSWLDTLLVIDGQTVWSQGQSSTQFGDLTWQAGFKVLSETPSLPALKLYFVMTFPTGNYQNLNPTKLGTDASGSGLYIPGASFALSKVVFFDTSHPLNFRLNVQFDFPLTGHVSGYNSYGGGVGTSGDISISYVPQVDFGFDACVAKHWVVMADLLYVYSSKASFQGTRGVTAQGAPAVVGKPSSDQWLFLPGFQYNPSSRLGLLGAAYITVYGRNVSQSIGGYASFDYVF